MALKEMGCSFGIAVKQNMLLDDTGGTDDKLSPLQREKVDHLFHVLYGEYKGIRVV